MSDTNGPAAPPDRIERKVIKSPAYFPLCPVHGVRMKQRWVEDNDAKYACTMVGCGKTRVVPMIEFVPLTTLKANGLR